MKRITILILFRADSLRRLYNLISVVSFLSTFKELSIYVREADSLSHRILNKVLPDNVHIEFVTDEDPILHKTWHFNQMISSVDSPFIGIWDSDVICSPTSLNTCIAKLLSKEASLVLPYNGLCLDTSDTIADWFHTEPDFSLLESVSHLMRQLKRQRLTGGAVLLNKEIFLSLGGENENYYGWGDDDYDRYIRFMNHNANIYRSETPLFHLTHPRGGNSDFLSEIYAHHSKNELFNTINNNG